MTDIITSRSAYSTYQSCPRRRYWMYESVNGQANGVRGWERRALALPLVTGQFVHEIPARVLNGEAIDVAISTACDGYMAVVQARGLEAEIPESWERAAAEQRALIEALGWAWYRARYPRLMEEFEVLAVERESAVKLSEDVTLATRLDLVARRKADGRAFLFNWKTVSDAGERWYQGFELDAQMMTETLGAQELLGEQIAGVIVEGFIKGQRVGVDERLVEVRDKAKRPVEYIQRSRLLYGYKCDANPPLRSETLYDYESTTRKGWHKFRVWEEDVLAKAGTSSIEYWVNWLPLEVVEAQFAAVPPILRNEASLESQRWQIVGVERRIREARQMADSVADDAIATESVLNMEWPQNTHSCLWPSKCSIYDICYTAGVATNPGDSGLYQPRVANHPCEVNGVTA